MEFAQTISSFVLQAIALLLVVVSGWAGSAFNVPVKIHFLLETLVGLLIVLSVRLAGTCLLNGNLLTVFPFICYASLSSYRIPAPWWIVSLKLLSFPVLDVALMMLGVGAVSRNFMLSVSNAGLYAPLWLIFTVGAWFTEQESRQYFLVLLRLEAAQREFDLAAQRQRVLLGMLLPPFIVERVLQEATGGGKFLSDGRIFSVGFPDFLLLELCCGSISGDVTGADAFSRWERLFCSLDKAFQRYLVTSLVGVVHLLGDTIRLGGPMMLPDTGSTEDGPGGAAQFGRLSRLSARGILSRAMKSAFPRQNRRGELESLTQTAAVGLLMALHEVLHGHSDFSNVSAFLIAESGAVTVVGTPPTFTVAGVVTRLASALGAAAPGNNSRKGIVAMTNKFDRILREGLQKTVPVATGMRGDAAPLQTSPLPPPFRRHPKMTWRLRGVGYVDLIPILTHEEDSSDQICLP